MKDFRLLGKSIAFRYNVVDNHPRNICKKERGFMENEWLQFVQDKWYIIVGAIIAIFIVINIVKTLVKWVIVLAIAAAIIYYGADYTEELKAAGSKIWELAMDEVYDVMKEEAQSATYTTNPDGSFTIESPNVKIEGAIDEDKVDVTFKGQTFQLDRNNSFVEKFIEEATK